MENQPAFTERRHAKRKISTFTLKYKVMGKENAVSQEAETLDVSFMGLSFISSQLFAIDDKINGQLITVSIPKPVIFQGTIKRIEKLFDDKFIHALIFDVIKDEDKLAIEKYVQSIDLDSILRLALKENASDVHFVANQPPIFRVQSELVPMDSFMPISPEEMRKMLLSILSNKQRAAFEQELELDFSYFLPEGNSFRVNFHLERGNLEAAFRVIPENIRSIVELGLPKVLNELVKKRRGLIIISGVAGSGKSTTLAAMIDAINKERKCMVISIEDPIEYVHKSRKSIIKQREVGVDTLSFANAIKHSLRQDPNVLLIGEMRDLDSISMAITAAETGHLVLTTLHTPNAVEAINRIIDVYPEHQQNQVLSQLSACLEGVISQMLLPRKDGKGMIVATEVLVASQAVRNLIRIKKIEQIYSYIESGEKFGMHTMDSSLIRLIREGSIDIELAITYAYEPQKLKSFLVA